LPQGGKGEEFMLLHFRLYATMAVIGGAILFGGNIGIAEWTEPVCLVELNNFETGQTGTQACISSDGLSIFFVRRIPNADGIAHYLLFEAVRDDISGDFTSERGLWELNPDSAFVNNPWISHDGLRLYYAQVEYRSGRFQRYIKMAARNSPQDQWQEARVFDEIHTISDVDSAPTLTEDELTMVWMSVKYWSTLTYAVYTATRESINSPFSAAVEVTELSSAKAGEPHLSGDGLRIYFTAPHPDTGKNNIYMMTRPSLDEPFGNMEHLDGVSGPDAGGGSPHLSPDEKTIYFNAGRGDTLYERGTWVSYWIDDPYDVAVESIEAAIVAKREAIAVITSGLDKERAALEALNELRATGEVGRVNIRKTKIQIFHAIWRQMRAIAELEKSIRYLEKSLEELDSEGGGKPGIKPDKPAREPKKPKAPLPR